MHFFGYPMFVIEMQEYVEITRQLKTAQPALKQTLMAALAGNGGDAP